MLCWIPPPPCPTVPPQEVTPAGKTRFILGCIFLVPWRLLLFLLSCVTISLLSRLTIAGLAPGAPLTPRRRNFADSIRWVGRLLLWSCGVRRVRVIGKRAAFRDAPLVVPNHIGLFESVFLLTRQRV